MKIVLGIVLRSSEAAKVPGFGSGVKSDVTKLAGNNPDLPSSSPFHQFASLSQNNQMIFSILRTIETFIFNFHYHHLLA
jgi:hypothetical protein